MLNLKEKIILYKEENELTDNEIENIELENVMN